MSVSARRCTLDHTAPWQQVGRLAPHDDALWDEPERTLDWVAAGGWDTVCLSIAWARLEPDPRVRDGDALARYARILSMAADRGLAPVAVLGDGWPWWLGEEYWLTPGSPDGFADHVGRVVGELGPACRHWVVRQTSPVGGWIDGSEPPGRRGAASDAWAVADNLLAGYVLAYEAIHEALPGAEVAVGLRPSTCYEWHRLTLDILWARRLGVERVGLASWLDGRRRAHDRAQPASSVSERVARAGSAALSPYGTAPTARHSPRRALDVVYTGAHDLAVDSVLLEWAPRRRPWDRAPSNLQGWCDEQRRLTPGVRLWVEDGGSAVADDAGRAGLEGYLQRPL